jgi:choline dehydrogenase-like flavoprotein
MNEYSDHICIVGAGTISNHLAGELLDRGHKVLVIEAGGIECESELLSINNYNFLSPSMLPENVHRVGGGGNYWIGRIGEFLEKDFREITGIRHESWPFQKDVLAPYYRSVYSKLSDSSLLDDEYILKNFSTFPDLPRGLAIRPIRYTEPKLLRNLFLDRLSNPKLVLLTETLVLEIEKSTDASKPRVLTRSSEGVNKSYEVKSVIVAGGALQSTKLFLSSKSIHNKSNNTTAGFFLMEHLDGYIGNIDVSKRNNQFIRNVALSPERILPSKSFLNCGISLTLDTSSSTDINVGFEIVGKVVNYRFSPIINGLKLPSKNFFFKPAFFLERVIRKVIEGSIQSIREKVFGIYSYSIWLKAEELPYEKSSLSLDDATGNLNYSHQISVETSSAIRSVLRKFDSLISELNLGKVRYYSEVIDDSKILKLRPNWHPMGTLRMGKPGESVVDLNLKVHGEENIYILSSAVFPTGSNQNPVFTTLALGTRLADHLTKVS